MQPSVEKISSTVIFLLLSVLAETRIVSTDELTEADGMPDLESNGFYAIPKNTTKEFKQMTRLAFDALRPADSRGPPPEPKKVNRQRKPNKNKGKQQKNMQRAFTLVDPSVLQSMKSNCEAQKSYLELTAPGCKSKTVVTQYCIGTCVSIYIPRPRARKIGPLFESCTQCRPSEVKRQYAFLECDDMTTLPKAYNVAVRCSCQAVQSDE